MTRLTLGAVAVLAGVVGCSAPAATLAVTAAKPQTCAQQYQAWKSGAVRAPGKQMDADAAALGKAAEDIPVMVGDLKALGADAAAMEAYPVPKCADPAGYWAQYLAAVKAAGDNAGSASGLAALILAEAPLRQVPAIQARLSAELAKTAGVKMPAGATQAPVPLPTLATIAPVTVPSPSPLPTLATVAPVTVAPVPVPTLATMAPVPTAGT